MSHPPSTSMTGGRGWLRGSSKLKIPSGRRTQLGEACNGCIEFACKSLPTQSWGVRLKGNEERPAGRRTCVCRVRSVDYATLPRGGRPPWERGVGWTVAAVVAKGRGETIRLRVVVAVVHALLCLYL